MFKGFDRSIWVRFWGSTFLSVGNNMIRPFMALYLANAIGASMGLIGFILMVRPIGSFFGNMLGGFYADKLGRKPVMIIGVALDGLALFGYALTHNPLWIAALSFLQGFGSSLADPAVQAMVADVTKPDDRARAYSLFYMGNNFGFAVGPLLAAGVILQFPKALFTTMSVLTLAFAAIVYFAIPETKPAQIACESEACKRSQSKIGYGFIWQDLKLILFLLGTVAIQLGYNQMSSYLPLHLNQILPQAAWLYGAMMSVNGFMCVVLSMPVTKFMARFNPYHVIKVGGLLYAGGMAILALNQSVVLMLVGYVVFSLGEIVQSSVWKQLLMDFAPDDMRARYMGAGSIAWITSGTIGPLAGGVLMGDFGGHLMFLIFAVIMAGSLLFYRAVQLLQLRERKRAAAELQNHAAENGKKASLLL